MKTYLVTGGAGFIGSNFVLYMLRKHDDVRIVNDDLERAAQELERTIDMYESNGGSTKDVSD